MSQTGKLVVSGALAASVMLVGAMQLASGHDLASSLPTQASASELLASTAGNVNREGKSDRAAVVSGATATRTVSIKLGAFADTTFLMRLPVQPSGATAGPGSTPQGSQIISTENERPVAKPIACEPSVSVLTEIAKRLQPGRCVT
ncbi:conserved protein of unknown function [Bradyrhizobium sp. ORS 285]|uniref:hypothetical protein n=1 Tax=Bradyrhizobium sp. ORS 285 TaxID=115808 RepID=UPI0002408430|nr:hypothetical protein [Bradyrhizobium sp. ORS 285]CCD86792.1 conserved hypothetical protein [Bradyrhizobium sp. ORS 285]SMX55858.1 conserved protein of unknown function [Bradyrhizobium sp. ORS 285]